MNGECMNPDVCERRFTDIERRIVALEKDDRLERLQESIVAVQVSIAALNGKIAGYLVAGGMLGAAVSFLIQYVTKRP